MYIFVLLISSWALPQWNMSLVCFLSDTVSPYEQNLKMYSYLHTLIFILWLPNKYTIISSSRLWLAEWCFKSADKLVQLWD